MQRQSRLRSNKTKLTSFMGRTIAGLPQMQICHNYCSKQGKKATYNVRASTPLFFRCNIFVTTKMGGSFDTIKMGGSFVTTKMGGGFVTTKMGGGFVTTKLILQLQNCPSFPSCKTTVVVKLFTLEESCKGGIAAGNKQFAASSVCSCNIRTVVAKVSDNPDRVSVS